MLTVATVFAAEDYNSSRSNTQTSIVNQQVGDILLRYAVGGAEINEATDALAVGISVVDLKAMLVKFGVSDVGITEVFAELDRLGTGDTPQSAAVNSGLELVKDEIIVPDTGDATGFSSGGVSFDKKEVSGIESETGLIDNIRENDNVTTRRGPRYGNITLKRSVFQDTSKNIIQNLRAAAPEERENLKEELKVSRGTFQTEIVALNLSIRENAKVLRDNFRENVRTVIGHVDHGKTARIAVAHGKGLRMLNRFRSATARFDHILGRLESRVEKLEARGVDISTVIPLIEEAKNMSVENEAKMEELKAKYESLLLGENVKGISEEARAIAKELKAEIETLHAKLIKIADDIRQAAGDYNSSISNSSTL
ncbi:MAG: hypothetical protein Q8P56_06315 [Candidatus Uhrbacteria bacterium]|nr:hypothetical protein [Candidatus Uhrbacteria bacterium]